MSQPSHDTSAHDKHFFDSFMLVLGVLVAVAIALIFLSRAIAAQTQGQYVLEDAKLREAAAERIAPIGKVAVSGADNSALEPPKETKVAAVAQDLSGEQVFTTTCNTCHGAGVAGAPKYGDKGAWGPRIAQGMPTLYEHALKGFQGKSGFMPMKGGRVDLSDKSVTNAVDYMVKAAK
jgi:cytochrome c5